MSTGEGRFLMALEKGKDRRSIAKQERANKRAADKKRLWSLLGKIGMFSGNPLIAGAAYLAGEFIPDALGVKEKKLKTGYFYGDELKDYNAELSKQRKQRAASVGIGLAANVFGSSVIPEGSTIQSMLKKVGCKSGDTLRKLGIMKDLPGMEAFGKINPFTMQDYIGTKNPYRWDVKGLNLSDRLKKMRSINIPYQTISNWRG